MSTAEGSRAAGRPGGAGTGPSRLGPGLRAVRADNPGPLTLDGSLAYLVGEERLAVVDPGPNEETHLEALEAAVDGRPVEAICLTHAHADHAGAARAAAERLGAPVAASPETLRRLGLRGRAVAEGDEVPVDGGASVLRALETPGHSADGLSWLWLPSRALFPGDLVLGRGSSMVVFPDGRVGPCLASLARLASLLPSRILPGHGEPVEDPQEKLAEYRRHRLDRERQVVDAVRAGARTLDGVREAVYGELEEGLRRPAELAILAHLAHLAEVGHELPPELASLPAEAARGLSAAPGEAPPDL